MAIAAQNDPGASIPVYLLANRAKALESTGHLAEAREGYQACRIEAEQHDKKLFAAHCMIGLSIVARLQGDLPGAHELIKQVADLVGTSAPLGSPAVIAIKIQRGELALAEEHLTVAQDELDAAWLVLGKVLAKKNDRPRAAAAYRTAVENLAHTVDGSHFRLQEALRLASSTESR